MQSGTHTVPEAAATRALQAADQLLEQSRGRLCTHHALRHRAARLRVYALNSLPTARASGSLAVAIEACLVSMERVLPAAHPEVAFYRHWLAKALTQQADAAKAAAEARQLRRRAHQAAQDAAGALRISYGRDHPAAVAWPQWTSAD